jgi:hypothetical protein
LQYELPASRTDIGKSSVKYYGVKVWGALPKELKDAPNVKAFKKHYKSKLLQE